MTQFRYRRLNNGLDVIAEVVPAAHTSAVGFFVKTGARDETPTLMGVSHFLEHMMFKATVGGRSAEDVNREFDEIGADYNAFTSHEQTVYYAHVLPEFLPRVTDLLGDMLRPALLDADFETEKNVILEEISMYDDRPEWVLQDKLIETFFTGHTLGHRVLGTRDTVGAMTAAQMRGYFDQRYRPDHITVAAAGKLDFDALCDQLEATCGRWPSQPAPRAYVRPRHQEHRVSMTDAKLTRVYIACMTPAPSAQDDRRYAAQVLADILGDSDGSRLYWALIDPGLADDADFSFMPQDQSGAYIASVSCSPERAEQVEQLLMGTVDALVQNKDVLADEVQRAVTKLATAMVLRDERPAGRMHGIGARWQYLGEYRPLQDELEALQAVRVEDALALCEAMPMRPRTIAVLGPGQD